MHAKIELLPTDKALMLKNQQDAQNTLSPHMRVLQFFESHFNAVRLGNLQDQQLFCRLVSGTVVALAKTQSHPLAREIHFRIVVFALKILQTMSPRNGPATWKLKDQILTAALSWFKHTPRYVMTAFTRNEKSVSILTLQCDRWSFGGNRLQIKAEDKVFADTLAILRTVGDIASQSQGSYKSLQAKQDLLVILIEHERSRLRVWLFPLEPERKHHIPSIGGKNPAEVSV